MFAMINTDAETCTSAACVLLVAGHIGIAVPDVHEACAFFEDQGVTFVKKPDEGQFFAYMLQADRVIAIILAWKIDFVLQSGNNSQGVCPSCTTQKKP